MLKGKKKNKRKQKIWLKITYEELENLFGTKRRTIQQWISNGLLNPTQLKDIINKYNNPGLLDRRTSCYAVLGGSMQQLLDLVEESDATQGEEESGK